MLRNLDNVAVRVLLCFLDVFQPRSGDMWTLDRRPGIRSVLR
ncbi:hypothetical protein SLEP1_g37838 [Rubroshorea leprosula]|uniref:Uncharacterized protein n=1 Tax=Rubroshorea leprosula TaxID=152421 RepID=A0AAV5KW61_9ROSI|nr:hypothetical protein SLEP1_g37838 [Rubroshorea leprosula]